ncbi:MAG TPA: MFS transporter [Desulfobacterales bacterium]|nr:MFS transporter [Desulfobacterales bacterium]
MMKARKETKTLFWGWYIVAGAFTLMALTYGARYSFGIFVQPLTAENGWSRSAVSLAASINLLMYALGGVFAGRLLDRIAPRWIVTIGAAVSAVGFFLCTKAQTPLQFYFAYGVLYGFGSSWTGTVTVTSSVGKWFIRRRGLAIGISSMGVSLGTMVLSPATAFMLGHFSWKTVFLCLGLALLVPGILIAQLLMRRTVPEAYGLAPDGQPAAEGRRRDVSPAHAQPALAVAPPAWKDPRFWILSLCHGTAVMAALMAFVHQVPYAVDQGIDPMAAATSLGTLGFAGLLGQFFFGWISDRMGDPKYAAALGYACMAVGTVILLETKTVEMLLAYSLVFGFGYGCLGPLLPILAADRFGRHGIGAIFGLLTFFVVGVGGSLGPLAGGMLYDATGSYRYAWWLVLVSLSGAIAGIVSLKRHRMNA